MTFLTGEVEVGLGRGTAGWREEKPTEGVRFEDKVGSGLSFYRCKRSVFSE